MGNKIKIISDGINHRVVDAETGREIPGVQCCRVTIEAGEPAMANLEIVCPEIEIISKIESIKYNDK